jgi:nicotinamide riboside kinase
VTVTPATRCIAVVGAECVGKTTLCQQLARELPGNWLPEYLREFCDRLGRTPRPDEQLDILRTQIRLEAQAQQQAAADGAGWVLCDSAPIITAIYSRILFGDSSLIEPALQHHRHYQATLLLLPDLPWVADGFLRDGAHVRARCHDELTQQLQMAGIAAHPIEGSGEARLHNALRALNAGREFGT